MNYKITNIEFGAGPWNTTFIYGFIGNPKPNQKEDNVHSITLIQGNGHNILVDTGVDTEDERKRETWNNSDAFALGTIWALRQVNLEPEDIDTVIITHAHLDHVGGIERFAHARIFMQQREFEAWEAITQNPEYSQATTMAALASDYPPIRALIEQGAVTLLNGNVTNLLPGIDLRTFEDCHSVVDQVVVVRNRNEDGSERSYVIAGDLALRPANLVGTQDFHGFLAPVLGRSGSAMKIYDAYKWILETVEDDMSRLVLPHDSTMSERFKSKPTERGLAIHYVCE